MLPQQQLLLLLQQGLAHRSRATVNTDSDRQMYRLYFTILCLTTGAHSHNHDPSFAFVPAKNEHKRQANPRARLRFTYPFAPQLALPVFASGFFL